jgi:hypothetical protein
VYEYAAREDKTGGRASLQFKAREIASSFDTNRGRVRAGAAAHTTASTFQSAAARLCLAQAPQPFAALLLPLPFPPRSLRSSPPQRESEVSREKRARERATDGPGGQEKGNSLILSSSISPPPPPIPQCYHCCNLQLAWIDGHCTSENFHSPSILVLYQQG